MRDENEQLPFDKALRDFVAGSELPYDAAQWERLRSRLDGKRETLVPVIPVGRRMPLYRVLLPAAAACLAVAVIWIGRDGGALRNGEKGAAAVANKAENISGGPIDTSAALVLATTSGKQPIAATSLTPAPEINAQHHSPNFVTPQGPLFHVAGKDSFGDLSRTRFGMTKVAAGTFPEQPSSIPKESFADSSAKTSFAILPKVTESSPRPQINLAHEGLDNDAVKPASGGRVALGIVGGYNVGDAKGAFTVGVSVQKPLGGRVQLETGLALVSGAYQTYRQGPPSTSSIPGIGTVTTPTFEETSSRLLYLQAAPTLAYHITAALSAGAGVDAQRLLSSATNAVVLDANGSTLTPQPLWDFGVIGKLDYRLAARLKAGLTYRKSLQKHQ